MYVPKPDGGNFTPVPAGNHVAICYRFIDLGTQTVEWKGAKKNQLFKLPGNLVFNARL